MKRRSDTDSKTANGSRHRSAIAVLTGFAMWATGVLALLPSEERDLPTHIVRSQAEAKRSLLELAKRQLETNRRKGRFEYDFNTIGFRPDPPVRYVIAFPLSCTNLYARPTGVTSSLDVLSRGVASNEFRPRTLNVAERDLLAAFIETSASMPCPDPNSGFVALAIGNLDKDDELDVWVIDQQMEPTQIHSDL